MSTLDEFLDALAAFQGLAPHPDRVTSSAVLFGNGGVTWSETRIPSGVAALLIGVMPFWTTLIEWMSKRGQRPTGTAIAGIVGSVTGGMVMAPR